MGATLSLTLKADSSLVKHGLEGEIWVAWGGTECVVGVTATSPFDSSTSKAVASATIKSSGSCAFDDSNITFGFYSDSAFTTNIGWAKFHEGSGSENWQQGGQSAAYYPKKGGYGYALTVTGGALNDFPLPSKLFLLRQRQPLFSNTDLERHSRPPRGVSKRHFILVL
jgi:hypothetical protein